MFNNKLSGRIRPWFVAVVNFPGVNILPWFILSFQCDNSEWRVGKRRAQSILRSQCKLAPEHHWPCLFHFFLSFLPTLYSCPKRGRLTCANCTLYNSNGAMFITVVVNMYIWQFSFRRLRSIQRRRPSLICTSTIGLLCCSKTTYWVTSENPAHKHLFFSPDLG